MNGSVAPKSPWSSCTTLSSNTLNSFTAITDQKTYVTWSWLTDDKVDIEKGSVLDGVDNILNQYNQCGYDFIFVASMNDGSIRLHVYDE